MQVYLGNLDAAIEQFHVALRLSPLDPRIFLAQTGMAWAHFLAGRYEEGSSWGHAALQQQPNFLNAHRIAMTCQALSGRIEEARQACAVSLQMDPTQRIRDIPERTPLAREVDVEKLARAFRIAGMPE